MRRITGEEWARKRRHGYASVRADGVRVVLALDAATGATVLEPVEVEGVRFPVDDQSSERGTR
jgi:hypothetical protein